MKTKYKIIMLLTAVVLFSGVFHCNAQTIPITPSGPNGAALVYDIVNGKWVRLAADTDGSIFTAAATWADDSPLYETLVSPQGAMFVYDTTNAVWRAATGSADGSLATSGGGGGGGDFADGGDLATANRSLGNTDDYDMSFIVNDEAYITLDTSESAVVIPKALNVTGGIDGDLTGDVVGDLDAETAYIDTLEVEARTGVPTIHFNGYGIAGIGYDTSSFELDFYTTNHSVPVWTMDYSSGSILRSKNGWEIADKGSYIALGSTTTLRNYGGAGYCSFGATTRRYDGRFCLEPVSGNNGFEAGCFTGSTGFTAYNIANPGIGNQVVFAECFNAASGETSLGLKIFTEKLGDADESKAVIAVSDGLGSSGTVDAITMTEDNTEIHKQLIINKGTAPASAAATGTEGEIRFDGSYVYFCTATDTWVRAAVATW